MGKKGYLLCNCEHLSLKSADRQRQADPERLLASHPIQKDELPVQ